jgi:glycerol-3-phosphate acyltransferase PlsY
MEAPLADALLAIVALLAGYLAGSIPVDGMLARRAGGNAGTGWEFLALTGDLAKGVLPVAIGSVTVSWSAGWLAGAGALLGACWPMLGRTAGGSMPAILAVLAGALFALASPAGVVATLCGLAVLGVVRLLRRDGRVAAGVAGFAVYPLVFVAAEADLRRLAAVLVLYGIAAVRLVAVRS